MYVWGFKIWCPRVAKILASIMPIAPCVGIVFVDNHSWLVITDFIPSCNQEISSWTPKIANNWRTTPSSNCGAVLEANLDKILTIPPLAHGTHVHSPHVQLMELYYGVQMLHLKGNGHCGVPVYGSKRTISIWSSSVDKFKHNMRLIF